MSSRPFVHLHNHTEYSLLDGANRIPDMVARAKELGQSALAISDHGVMFGIMEFQMECAKKGIKPIFGMEAYVAPRGLHNKGGREDKDSYHLLLLARDLEGYRNLCKLSTIAALQGYYYKPRIDHELLRAHSKGLIATSTCLGSEVNQALLENEYDKAQYTAGMYAEMFGPENYFIELQDHNLPEQRECNEHLRRIARELKLPLVATNDAHYLCKQDAQPHDVLLCIQTGALVEDQKRMKFPSNEFYLKSGDEMAALFPGDEGAIENTAMIAEMCDVQLGKQRAEMPKPDLPEGVEALDYLRQLANEGLVERIKNVDEPAHQRLNYELEVIEKTGFPEYFLLVREFARYARENGIFIGVRGSAAGSLVSYTLGITDVDPLEYDLTFERFLNIERIAPPDIDMDFEDARRDEVIKYVTEKYGADHVAQIVTFGTLGARAAIKDCGRVQGYSPQETDRICKTIPNLPGMTLDRAVKESGEFREMINKEPRVKDLVEVAKSVEGMARHCGVHAAGIVISKDPLMEHIPLYRGQEGQAITAFEMGILEKLGLLKMDFLGLSNLTVLSRALNLIKDKLTPDHPLAKGNVWDLPLDDPAAYEILARGETVGVFQLESGGMTRYVKELKPSNVRELAAMVALYRPGPMEHIPKFIDTKFGRQQATYLHELMRPLLEETYGIIVYQDQVLKLVQALAGFSLGKADILRRAMGKKDKDAMSSMQKEFVAGCAERDIDQATADQVWELLMPFAGYAFNKAHAVCYALIAYQTAYLKANFPVEYMTALLGVYQSKEDRVVACIEECRRMKIPVLPPDVNSSISDFRVDTTLEKKKTIPAIRFGLAAIKGVGESIVEKLIEDREENGPFTHLFEFAERMKMHGLNRTALEALVKAGALDSIEPNRKKHLDHVDGAIGFAENATKNRLAGQDSLFGEETGSAPSYPALPELEPLSRTELLALEKEVMGIYVSDHPLRGYETALRQAASHSCADALELEEGKSVKLAGVIAGLRTQITKQSGKKMATLVLEDFSGQISVTVFPAIFEKVNASLVKDSLVKASGVVMHRERPGSGGEKSVEIRLEDISGIDQSALALVDGEISRITLGLPNASRRQIRQLVQVLKDHPGAYDFFIQLEPRDSFLPVPTGHRVAATPALEKALKSIVPHARVEFPNEASEYEDEEAA